MTVFLLSLGGFPPLAGFIGKWYIFNAAVQEGLLARHHRRAHERRLGVLLSSDRRHDVDDGRPGSPPSASAAPAAAGLVLATLAVFYLGVLPTSVLHLALDSISTIF